MRQGGSTEHIRLSEIHSDGAIRHRNGIVQIEVEREPRLFVGGQSERERSGCERDHSRGGRLELAGRDRADRASRSPAGECAGGLIDEHDVWNSEGDSGAGVVGAGHRGGAEKSGITLQVREFDDRSAGIQG